MKISTTQAKEVALFGAIKLKDTIKAKSYYAIIIHNVVLGLFMNGVELLQQLILSDKDYYDIPAEDAIKTNANITLFDLMIRLFLAALYGALIDKHGRKLMIFWGYFLTSLGIFFLPISGYFRELNSLFPWYYLARFLYTNGTSIILLMPFIADYVEDESKGKAAGINAVALATGFLASTTIIKWLYSIYLDLKFISLILSITVLIVGMAYSTFLKGGSTYYKITWKPVDGDASLTSSVIEQEVKITPEYIKQIIRERPWISVSFVFALLNGANLGITSQILNLFVRNLGPDVPEGQATLMVEYANIAGLISTIFCGAILDSKSPIYLILPVLGIGVSTYSFAWTIDSPDSAFLVIVAVSSGISYSTCVLLMNYLGFVHYPGIARGRLYALANLLSFFGNLLITVIGGNLVSVLGYHIPFFLIAGCTILGSLVFANIYLTKIKSKTEKKKSGDEEEQEEINESTPLIN